MLATAYYFLQVIICSGLMTGYYWIVLRNKRFHQYNRFFLLAITLLSWIVPLVKIQFNHQVVTADPQMIQLLMLLAQNNSQLDAGVVHSSGFWDSSLIPAALYLLVSAALFIMMIRAFVRVFKLLRTHSCRNIGDVYLILTTAKGTPFSFFRYIFWNDEIDLRSEAGKQILQHELTHVNQKHSIDKIFMQLVLVAGWFNPFFWLIKKEMEMIHEFIADRKAVSDGDTATLAQMLLTASFPQQRFALTNPFFSPIKRRLQMLTNNRTPRFSYLRRLVILPLLAVMTILFAFRNKEQRQEGTLSVASVMENVIDELSTKAAPVNIEEMGMRTDTIITKDGKALKVTTDTRGTVTIQPVQGQEKVNIKTYSKVMPKVAVVIVDGKRVDNSVLETLNPDQISTVNIYKGMEAAALFGDAASNGVVVIHTKAAMQRASVDTVFASPSKDGFNSLKADAGNLNGIVVVPDTVVRNADGSQPLIMIDGAKGSLKSVSPTDIARVDVLKNESAIKKYGNDGQHGVIEITTFKKILQANPNITAVTLGNLQAVNSPTITTLGTMNNLTVTGRITGGVFSGVLTANTLTANTLAGISNSLTQPQFPGGREGLNAYLDRTLNRDIARKNGAPPGIYAVMVTFEVDTDGNLNYLNTSNDPGYGTKEEAMRVFARGPRWVPAKYNGSLVKYNTAQVITFKVAEQDTKTGR